MLFSNEEARDVYLHHPAHAEVAGLIFTILHKHNRAPQVIAFDYEVQ